MKPINLEGTILHLDYVAKITMEKLTFQFFNADLKLMHIYTCKDNAEFMSIREQIYKPSDVACSIDRIQLDLEEFMNEMREFSCDK